MSETEDMVKLFDAGMACARLNLSHGTVKVGTSFYNELVKRSTIKEIR